MQKTQKLVGKKIEDMIKISALKHIEKKENLEMV